MALRWLCEGVGWRWRFARRAFYLRRHFRNGAELADSYWNKTPCAKALSRKGGVIGHPAHRAGLAGMILEVWMERVYTKPRGFSDFQPGDVIIDAGANIGLFSIDTARRHPECRIIAFEPFAENYAFLLANLASFGITAVTCRQAALSGATGRGLMIDGGARSQDHRLRMTDHDAASPDLVETFSLADVPALTASQSIALFKCDIEGGEYPLFATAAPEDLQRITRYAIEYHDNLQPGTLDLIQKRLSPTHHLIVEPSSEGGYGMLYAHRKTQDQRKP